MECCEGLSTTIEILRSDRAIDMNAPDWLTAPERSLSHLHHRYYCFGDQVWWESTKRVIQTMRSPGDRRTSLLGWFWGHPLYMPLLGHRYGCIGDEVWWGPVERKEMIRSDRSICVTLLGWSVAHHLDVSLLHRQYRCCRDEVWWGSMENTRSGVIRCEYFHELTGLIFNASLTHLKPSTSVLFPPRSIIVRVFEKHHRRSNQIEASVWTHLVAFQRLSQIFHSLATDVAMTKF